MYRKFKFPDKNSMWDFVDEQERDKGGFHNYSASNSQFTIESKSLTEEQIQIMTTKYKAVEVDCEQ